MWNFFSIKKPLGLVLPQASPEIQAIKKRELETRLRQQLDLAFRLAKKPGRGGQ